MGDQLDTTQGVVAVLGLLQQGVAADVGGVAVVRLVGVVAESRLAVRAIPPY